MSLIKEVDYSIIICTYNPNELALSRCLSAVRSLKLEDFSMEVILVDNNSTERLAQLYYVKEFLREISALRLIEVKEPGLINARIGGVEASKGSCIVFFDDDNEPESDYLKTLHRLRKEFPMVAAWGPGTVHVDFIDGVSSELSGYPGLAQFFQERSEPSILYSNQHLWQNCYPYGTGLCMERTYVMEYIELVNQGRFSLTGRSAGQMSSGEDTQMVLYCISKGAAAGVAPNLKVTHIIPGKRVTMDYLKRLTYGTSVCYSTCLVQVYPDHIKKIRTVKERKFITRAIKKYLSLFINSKPKKVLNLIQYLGVTSGDYFALDKPIPKVVTCILKKLKAI